jgi:hypothetical protein
MQKFYCLDLDMYAAADFATESLAVDGRTKADAANTMSIFENLTDGATARIMVADNRDGTAAETFTVTQRVNVTYSVRKTS